MFFLGTEMGICFGGCKISNIYFSFMPDIPDISFLVKSRCWVQANVAKKRVPPHPIGLSPTRCIRMCPYVS